MRFYTFKDNGRRYNKFTWKIDKAFCRLLERLIYKYKIIQFRDPRDNKGWDVEIWLFGKKLCQKKLSSKTVMKIEQRFDLQLF